MSTKYKYKHWGTSLKRMPWDGRTEITNVEKLISSTIGVWYQAKHRESSNEEIEFINSITPIACHYCFCKDFIKYGKNKQKWY